MALGTRALAVELPPTEEESIWKDGLKRKSGTRI
jgi:hypothetical protein